MTASLLVHATGIAALGLSVRSTLYRCDRGLRRGYLLAGILWALNNFLLDATTGAALSCVSVARTGTASLLFQRGNRIRIGACALFIVISLVAASLTWRGWLTLLPVAASILVTYAAFFLSGSRLRLALLISALLWTQNVLSLHSPEQIGGNLLGIAAAAVGLWRTRKIA
ncbi:MAG TPA: YgjV family protein [Burkholderiaceae bacterium]|nr:YgjV family protein [Burkholderiaceae bacterium]